MSAKRSSLGRGLGALIKEVPAETSNSGTDEEAGINRVPLSSIVKSPWQPRKHFEAEALEDLIASVKEHGILQPLLVRRVEDRHELIAGERRMRAAELAGLNEVPVVLMEVDDKGALELALIENLQREDLNIIEEAEGYRLLAERFELTQEQVAERVGKARASVANTLRLLSLPDPVKRLLAGGDLSPGHAKVLLGLDIAREQELLAEQAVREGLSVRALEKLVARAKRPARKPRAERSDIPADHLSYLSDQLHQHLGTSVRISPCKTLSNGKKAKGCVEVDFYSTDDLDRLLHLLGISEEPL